MTPPPFEVAEPFRLNLLRLRRRVGLSQEQLAARASLHRTAIGLLEKGERLPRIDTLVRLAASLEASPGELLDGIEWVPPRDRAEGTFLMRGPFDRQPVPRDPTFRGPAERAVEFRS